MVNTRNLKTLKFYTFSKNISKKNIICSKCSSKDEKYFKDEESIKTLKILG